MTTTRRPRMKLNTPRVWNLTALVLLITTLVVLSPYITPTTAILVGAMIIAVSLR